MPYNNPNPYAVFDWHSIKEGDYLTHPLPKSLYSNDNIMRTGSASSSSRGSVIGAGVIRKMPNMNSLFGSSFRHHNQHQRRPTENFDDRVVPHRSYDASMCRSDGYRSFIPRNNFQNPRAYGQFPQRAPKTYHHQWNNNNKCPHQQRINSEIGRNGAEVHRGIVNRQRRTNDDGFGAKVAMLKHEEQKKRDGNENKGKAMAYEGVAVARVNGHNHTQALVAL